MEKITLKAQEREILGKKVRVLRRQGFIPGHVFGKKVETEHVTVSAAEFLKVFQRAGETGLVDLRIGDSKVRPVLIRDVQLDPVLETPIHIDFYQVNLMEKVRVAVPIVIVGEEPESVKAGEMVVIQPTAEVEVEALPTDLPENIEVDIAPLQQIDDAITVAQLKVPAGVEVMADSEAVVVKLDSAVSAEVQAEQEAEAAAAAAVAEAAAGVEGAEGGEAAEGETPAGEEKPAEESKEE